MNKNQKSIRRLLRKGQEFFLVPRFDYTRVCRGGKGGVPSEALVKREIRFGVQPRNDWNKTGKVAGRP